MNNYIFLRQVLELMAKKDAAGNPLPFDVEVRTFNANNKMGGVLKCYKDVKLLTGKKLKGKPFIEAEHFYRVGKDRRNPNHWRNCTRNIELQNGQKKKVKFRYITKFNGLEVVY